MKAIRIDRTGGPDTLHMADVPTPHAGSDQVLIRQSVAGVNFIDVYVRSGLYKRDLPLTLGCEGAGIVESVGTDVAGLAPGQRVAYTVMPGTGGYAEYNVVPARDVVPIPDAVDDRTACAVMLQGLTAHYLAHSTFPIKNGDTVVVHAAAGGVGQLLTQLAKARGATVIATAGGPDKVALAQRAGADHVIDYRAADFAPEVKRLTSNLGVAAVYDSIGADTWERSMSVLAPRGTLVLYGASSGPVPPIDPQRLAAAGSIYVTRPTISDYKRTRAELLGRANDLFAAVDGGRLEVLIGATYPLAEAPQAHRDLEARKTTGKLLLMV